jgi:hypothetical protein
MALQDITPDIAIRVDDTCGTLTFIDQSEYGDCENPDANREFVFCRTLSVRNLCNDEQLDVGGCTQQICLELPQDGDPLLDEGNEIVVAIGVPGQASTIQILIEAGDTRATLYQKIRGSIASQTFLNLTVTYNRCASCELVIASNIAGYPFVYSGYISSPAPEPEDPAIETPLEFRVIEENCCVMPLPSTGNDEYSVPYPGDMVIEVTLRLIDETGLEFVEVTKVFPLTCILRSKFTTLLLAELSDCCDTLPCLPESNRLRNYLDAIDEYVRVGDYESACDAIKIAGDNINSPCYGCGS